MNATSDLRPAREGRRPSIEPGSGGARRRRGLVPLFSSFAGLRSFRSERRVVGLAPQPRGRRPQLGRLSLRYVSDGAAMEGSCHGFCNHVPHTGLHSDP